MNKATAKDRGRNIALLIAISSTILTILFVWFRLTRPSDGARLVYSVFAWKPEGVGVTSLGSNQNDWQDNAIVIAIENQPLEVWIKDLFNPTKWRSIGEIGQTVPYTIIRDGEEQELSVKLGHFPIKDILATYWGPLLFALVSQVLATLVLLRRSYDRAAQALFIWAWSGSHTYAWSLGQQIIDLTNGFGFWLAYMFTPILWLLYWSSMLHFALIFPQKNPLVQRFPKIMPAVYVGAYSTYFIYIGITLLQSSSMTEWMGTWSIFPNFIALIYLTLMVMSVIWGYKRLSDPANRQKVRWLVYGASISGGGGLILWILPPLVFGHHIISANTLGLLTLPFPVTLAIAILRYQLFDIDLLINRTLVYGLLTGSLALMYFSSVVLLQTLLRTLTGETSQIAIVASTLGIATIFTPLRRRVQRFIDRRFYRSKYDAERALAAFSEVLRQEVDLRTLESQLIAIVQETMYPKHVSIWLRESEQESSTSKGF